MTEILWQCIGRPARAGWFPTDERGCWMPAGRHNRTAVLPLG